MKINKFEESLYIPDDYKVWNKVRDGIINGADAVGIKLTKQQWETIADCVVDSLHTVSKDRKYKKRHYEY